MTKTGMLFLMATVAFNAAAQTPYPKYYDLGDSGFAEACAEEKEADFSIGYDHDDRLNLHIGAVRHGVQKLITFTFDELRPFWGQQRHKDFIVVTVAKSTLKEEQTQALVSRLNTYFFEMGFRRVRIHQGYSAGLGVLSDVTVPKKDAPR